jgi:hypothetical protein
MAREALRYLENAKEILKKSPIEGKIYTDKKYLKSACGVAYLGVLQAIDEYLLKKGLMEKELPKKVEEYQKALKRYGGVHNGKLLREFDALYHGLHIAGYYRGDIFNVDAVKSYMRSTKEFIEKLRTESP